MNKPISAINFAAFSWVAMLLLWAFSSEGAPSQNTSVVVWEYYYDGLTNVPAGLTNVAQVAAGDGFCLALNNNGTVVAWNANGLETNILAGSNNIVAVCGGDDYALGLDNNGMIHEWGNGPVNFPPTFSTHVGINFGGTALQSDGTVSISGDSFNDPSIPSTANNIVAIATGAGFYLALRSDGTVVAWGDDLSGGTDVPAGLTNVVAIAAEENNGFALQANGVVVGWGVDYYGQGQIGSGSGLSNVVSICGDMALQSNGVVVPLGDAIDFGIQPPVGLTNVVAVDGETDWAIALIKTGKPSVLPIINESVYSGSSALLTSSAVGAFPLTYRWQRNGVPIAGANRSWLIITNAQAANSGSYSVTVTNASGAATSVAGQLTVVDSAPIIDAQPTNVAIPPGNTAAFSVTVSGSPPFTYQWQLDHSAIPGATNALLLMPDVTTMGRYRVLITNAIGSVISTNGAVAFAPSVVVDFGDSTGVANIPSNLTNAVEIINRGNFALALNANGSVVGWGDDAEGEINVPPNVGNAASQIAAGGDYSLALVNGTVIAWGDDSSGDCNVPYMTNAIGLFVGNAPAALTSSGTIVPWGGGFVPAGLSNVIAVAEGGCCLALQGDGNVVAWGSTSYGLTNVPSNLSNVVAIAAGESGCLALSANGQITAWGGVTNVPAGLTNVVGIAARPNSPYDVYSAVTASGAVVSWGERFLALAGYPNPTDPLATNVPASISNAAAVFLQPYGGLTLNRNSTVSGWGIDGYESAIPPWLTNVVAISGPMVLEGQEPPRALPLVNEFAYSGSTAVLEANASGFPLTYQWQLNGVNISGANQPWLMLTNVQAPGLPPLPLANYTVIVSNAFGSVTNAAPLNVVNSPPIILAQPQSLELPPNNNFTFSVSAIGSQPISYQWQFNGTNISGANSPSFAVANAQLPAAGYYRVVVSNPYGTLVSSNAGLSFSITSVAVWGDNYYGELNVYSNLTDVLSVAAGNSHDVAVLADGGVVAWGDNSYGETQVPPNVTNVVSVSAGSAYSLALKADGTVIGWGVDNYGQIDVPRGLSNVVSIAAGGLNGMALQSNGVVRVWGYPELTNIPSSVTNVVSIAASALDCLVLRSDGTVVEWGDDYYGQTNSVSTLTNIVALGSGSSTYCNAAIKADGTVVVWGPLAYSSLEPPPGLSNVISVALAPEFGLAMLANRTAVAWGPAGSDGVNLPPGLTNVTQIGCGSESGIILDPAGGVITLVPAQPASGFNVGYLQATLTPPAAVAAGGGWGIVGQPYFSSNTNFTVPVSAGQPVALAFQSVNGWNVPVSRAVTVPMGGLTNLAISYAVEPPVMSALPGTGFGLTGTTNTTYRIQSSTNLVNNQWLTLSTNTLRQGFNKVAPWPPATHTPPTYYRAVWLP
jgi:alpha-tubulin suppressor-like RCC1 family protein